MAGRAVEAKAHTFRARAKGVKGDFCFDSGPSLYGGLSGERILPSHALGCTNGVGVQSRISSGTSSPLKHVYQKLATIAKNQKFCAPDFWRLARSMSVSGFQGFWARSQSGSLTTGRLDPLRLVLSIVRRFRISLRLVSTKSGRHAQLRMAHAGRDFLRWNAFIPEGEANAAIGYEEFVTKLLPRFGGPDAAQQWERLMKRIIPMADAICNGPPPSFVREDIGVAATLTRYLTKLKSIPGGPQKLSEPFSKFLEDAQVFVSEGERSQLQRHRHAP